MSAEPVFPAEAGTRLLTPEQVSYADVVAAMRTELEWWRELASRLVPGSDLPTVGGDLGPYRYRISRAGYIEEKT